MKNEENKKGKVYIAVAAIVIIVGAIVFFKLKADTKNVEVSQPVQAEAVNQQAEPVIARIDIAAPLADVDKPPFEVYVNGSDTPEKQAKWMPLHKIQGYVIQKDKSPLNMVIKANKDVNIKFTLRGIRDLKNEKLVEHWVNYKSFIVDGKKLISKDTPLWYGKRLNKEIKAKAGQEYKVYIEWTKADK